MTGPVIIKRYANRRLDNAIASDDASLADLAAMADDDEDIAVVNAVAGDDVTHSILKPIISKACGP